MKAIMAVYYFIDYDVLLRFSQNYKWEYYPDKIKLSAYIQKLSAIKHIEELKITGKASV